MNMDKVVYRLIETKRKWWTEKEGKVYCCWDWIEIWKLNFQTASCCASVWWTGQEFQRLVLFCNLALFRNRITTRITKKRNIYVFAHICLHDISGILHANDLAQFCCVYSTRSMAILFDKNIISHPCKYSHKIW